MAGLFAAGMAIYLASTPGIFRGRKKPMTANVRLKQPAPGAYPDGRPERTARWALNQALHRWPHVVTRLDVLAIAAGVAQRDGLAVTFGPDRMSAADVLAALKAGDDPRPREE